MGEIKDFIELYVEESDMIPEILEDMTINLTANIQDELTPGHGYEMGDLHDSIQSNITSKNNLGGVIEAYSPAEYAEWVNDGTPAVQGKLMKMPWGYRMSRKAFPGYHFLEQGLSKTVAMYR